MTSEILTAPDIPALPYPMPPDQRYVGLEDLPPGFRDQEAIRPFLDMAGFASMGDVQVEDGKNGADYTLVIHQKWELTSRIPGIPTAQLVGNLPSAGGPFAFLREEDRETVFAYILWSWFTLRIRETARR